MDAPLDTVITFDIITSSPSSGAAADADTDPTFEVFEGTTDTDIGVGGNLAKRTSKTGDYRGTFTASTANGFEAGKWYNVVASATVGGVAGKCVAKRFRVVPAETVAGVPKVDLAAILGTVPTESAAGRLAGAFTVFFDVAAPVLTVESVNQTGDSYVRIGANGAGLTVLAQAGTALSTAEWTSARALKLDNLDAALSSRLAAAGYTAPDNATIAAIFALVSTLPNSAAVTAALGALLIENGKTFVECGRGWNAALLGTTEDQQSKFKSLDGAKDRIAATIDENSDRTAVVLDLS